MACSTMFNLFSVYFLCPLAIVIYNCQKKNTSEPYSSQIVAEYKQVIYLGNVL